MPYAENGYDGARIYFEDEGGPGVPVLLHDGFGDSVADLREWRLAQALEPTQFRLIYVDHRGHGRSDKPHDPAAYSMPIRVADATAVLDRLGIARAHFIGRSWGGRLCFGIGEHASERVLSLVIGGNQPYAWPDTALTRLVGEALAAGRENGSMEPLAHVFEQFWRVRFAPSQRERLLDNDPLALDAAYGTAIAEGAVSTALALWRLRCLIFVGAADADFLDGARRAAREIPNAELLLLEDADHYAAHLTQSEALLQAVLETLHADG
jgi:pimeloyl-ACP methyl ester carboxylesterase